MSRLDPKAMLEEAYGFLVDDASGPVGIVDEVRSGPSESESSIVIACGWFGHRRLTLSCEDVDEILPEERRLIVRSGATRRMLAPSKLAGC
jgi:hypothetical protein